MECVAALQHWSEFARYKHVGCFQFFFVNVNTGCPGHICVSFLLRREENSAVEQQGSAKTSLLGSLQSFASGIRNFWRNL
jgi:hypothetical protein